jgi:hypothetical protein
MEKSDQTSPSKTDPLEAVQKFNKQQKSSQSQGSKESRIIAVENSPTSAKKPSDSAGPVSDTSHYSLFARGGTTPQNPQQEVGTNQSSSMLQRWQEEEVFDQPYHAIRAYRPMTEDNKNAAEDKDEESSIHYYDPDEQSR